MTLKHVALLALIGTCLATIVLLIALVNDLFGVSQGLLPPVRAVTSLIYSFAGVSVAVFFYTFYTAQS